MFHDSRFNYCCSRVQILGALLALMLPFSGFASTTNLTFGLYTTDKPSTLVKAYRPILTVIEQDLSATLGEPVNIKLQIAKSYQEGIDALVSGNVDFSQLGPASYIEAKNLNTELQILALDSKDGSKTFQGVISVLADSPIKEIADLSGASFAFGNEGSTIGRYLSQAYLVQHGVTASKLNRFDYLGRHDRVGHAVAQGTYDAGALKEGTFKKLVKKGLPLRALARFPNVNKPWVASSAMEQSLVDALKQVMFNLDAPKAFKALGRKQFVPGGDEDFRKIRNAINNNSRFFRSSSTVETVMAED